MTEIQKLEQRVARLEQEFQGAVQLLRLVEWSGADELNPMPCCPVCGALRDRVDHHYACTLAIMIGAPMRV